MSCVAPGARPALTRPRRAGPDAGDRDEADGPAEDGRHRGHQEEGVADPREGGAFRRPDNAAGAAAGAVLPHAHPAPAAAPAAPAGAAAAAASCQVNHFRCRASRWLCPLFKRAGLSACIATPCMPGSTHSTSEPCPMRRRGPGRGGVAAGHRGPASSPPAPSLPVADTLSRVLSPRSWAVWTAVVHVPHDSLRRSAAFDGSRSDRVAPPHLCGRAAPHARNGGAASHRKHNTQASRAQRGPDLCARAAGRPVDGELFAAGAPLSSPSTRAARRAICLAGFMTLYACAVASTGARKLIHAGCANLLPHVFHAFAGDWRVLHLCAADAC